MKVFLTGGTGFIGSHLVLELLASGDEVTILARNPSKVPQFLEMPGVSVLHGELDDTDLIRAGLAGHDACIHNALHWEEASTELQLKDTRASVLIFEAAADVGVEHMIYTSSTAVCRPFRPRMTTETRLAPTDFYGATKAASELFLSAFSHQTRMRCNVIRPGPTLGGPAFGGGPTTSDRRVTEYVRHALEGSEIRVPEHDGRQFIGAEDLAKLFVAVLHSGVNREVLFGVAQNFTTWEQVALAVTELSGSTSRLIVEDIGADPVPSLFDVDPLDAFFGFRFDSTLALRAHINHQISQETSRMQSSGD